MIESIGQNRRQYQNTLETSEGRYGLPAILDNLLVTTTTLFCDGYIAPQTECALSVEESISARYLSIASRSYLLMVSTLTMQLYFESRDRNILLSG